MFNILFFKITRVRKEAEAPGLKNEVKQSSHMNGNGDTASCSKWTFEMTQVLIKAVNLFPAGTQKR